jgi:hypothetical protein
MQRSEIKTDFDLKNKVFCLTIPLLHSEQMPESVKKYIEARKDMSFKPHKTFFKIDRFQALLIQEIPFSAQDLRKEVDQFWHVAKHCHQMLSEIAIEEAVQFTLDSHF